MIFGRSTIRGKLVDLVEALRRAINNHLGMSAESLNYNVTAVWISWLLPFESSGPM